MWRHGRVSNTNLVVPWTKGIMITLLLLLLFILLMISWAQKSTCLENRVPYLCFTRVRWTCRQQTTGISDLKTRKKKLKLETGPQKLNTPPLAVVNRDNSHKHSKNMKVQLEPWRNKIEYSATSSRELSRYFYKVQMTSQSIPINWRYLFNVDKDIGSLEKN